MKRKVFSRLAEIPGVGYEPGQVDMSHLSARLSFPGQGGGDPWWPDVHALDDPTAGTSEAPASQWLRDLSGLSAAEIMTAIAEALELPGDPADYHFAIMNGYRELWRRRRADATVLPHVEHLCALDLRLIRARPEAAQHEPGGEPEYFSIPAFNILKTLYLAEGEYERALAVAEQAEQCGQAPKDIERLRERVNNLRAGDE